MGGPAIICSACACTDGAPGVASDQHRLRIIYQSPSRSRHGVRCERSTGAASPGMRIGLCRVVVCDFLIAITRFNAIHTRRIKHRLSANLQHRARSPPSFTKSIRPASLYSHDSEGEAQGKTVVRLSTMIMIAVAVVFGLLAVFVAQAWLNSQAEMRARNLEAQKKPVATQTIVVAAKSLRFRAELSGMSLREIPWTQDAVPPGAFSKISDLTSTRRVVLTAIEANEPILSS